MMKRLLNNKWVVLAIVAIWFIGGTTLIYFLFDHFHLWLIVFLPIIFWEIFKFVGWIIKSTIQEILK